MTGAHAHLALLYDGDDDLVSAVLAALAGDAGADDLIVLALRPVHVDPVVAALAEAEYRPPLLLPRPEIHVRPAAGLATQRRLMRHPGRVGDTRVWFVTEPDHGTTPHDWAEAGRYEATCTLTLDGHRLTTICAYPRRGTPAPVVATVLATHGGTASSAVRDSLAVLAGLSVPAPIPAPAGEPVLRMTGIGTLHELGGIRRRVTESLATVPTLIRTDFVAALNEVLTNACVHGVPPVDLTVWCADGRAEARVVDRGAGFDDPLAGYRPGSRGARTGTGLWLARQAADDLDVWGTPDRFTVRLATAVAPARGRELGGAVARAENAHARAAFFGRRRPYPFRAG